MRIDGRQADQLRTITMQRNFTRHAGGSVLVSFGDTRVLCTAIIEKGVPPWLAGKGQGWLTAEYAMLPSSTHTRKKRDSGKPDGRSVEIQRLIGRVLRGVIEMNKLGENTLWLDCDVIQADGGTRTAAITGAYVALSDAVQRATRDQLITANPIIGQVAAISVGIVDGQALLDLNYQEDSAAQVDMNVAMLADGSFVELQATGEHATFSPRQFNGLLRLAVSGIRELHKIQLQTLKKRI
ncbi:MAG: ribonuclease PH [Planctomycetia bacterium]|nr:ribonuclease PH [Planctomycetia bacterium]